MFNYQVSELQENVVVGDAGVTGTLHKLTDGDLVDAWGEGNFLALKFTDIDPDADSIMVGLRPTYPGGGDTPVDDDSGLQDIKNDPDKNGAWKITDKATQKFKVVTTKGELVNTQIYDLSGLTIES